jgi:hypothetical protein
LIKRILPTEDEEQAAFVQWFRLKWPDVRIFAIPNGGKQAWITAKRMKATGRSPGVPDLNIPAWEVWVEMKRQKGGSLSDDQKDWHEYLRGLGHTVFVAKGAEEAKKIVEHHYFICYEAAKKARNL